jgi:secretion/DNA translocation related TadE-like protein
VRRDRDEAGAGVVLVLALVALLVTVALVSGGVVGVVVAHRRAQAAADLAALAGAGAISSDPCAAARAMALRNGATQLGCVVDGADLIVTVSVTVPLLLGERDVTARSRAGPSPPTTMAAS